MEERQDLNRTPPWRAKRLDPATEIGMIVLKVTDLARSLAFYSGIIGLRIFDQNERTALLGAGSRPVVALTEVPGAGRPPAGATGLYHAAILLPDRHALAIKAAQLAALRVPFGQSDHLVSEALYLTDPDGNGLELYRDRPRSAWTWTDQQVRMATEPIDFDDLFAGIAEDDPALAQPDVPDGTRLGHVHLRVADIPAAEQFYQGVLGFDVTARWPGALFMSAGGYHHHLGLNTWESKGGRPPTEPSTGLQKFSLVLPDEAELNRLVQAVAAAGVPVEHRQDKAQLLDPFGNCLELTLRSALVLGS